MTSKERAYLRKLASNMNAIYQVGKSIVTPELIDGISEALEARELIKVNVLKNCMDVAARIHRPIFCFFDSSAKEKVPSGVLSLVDAIEYVE
jgi:RNA-binding protein YhbY